MTFLLSDLMHAWWSEELRINGGIQEGLRRRLKLQKQISSITYTIGFEPYKLTDKEVLKRNKK
jgi:hypothetical protein